MEQFFKEISQKIQIYVGKEVETDPYEHSVMVVLYNPISISAIVTDLIASQIQWKMPGIRTSRAKEVIIEDKYENLFLMSQKITIDNVDYQGWRDNGKIQYRNEGSFIRFYVYSRD